MPESAHLLRELFVIFVWAKAFGEVFERLSLPAVLGEILAGIILGPYALAVVAPSETVFSLAQIGAIFLLFTVGLQTRSQELIQIGNKSLQVALAGIVLPFGLGFFYMTVGRAPVHQATFVAAAMVATSVGITARVLTDLDLLDTRAAKIILGAAVFDDILGMILLAVVIGLVTSGAHWLELGILAAEAIGFAALLIFLGPRMMRRVTPRWERMSMHNPQLVLALAICLGLSVAAEKVGLAAIIGAFFAGLVFAEYAEQWKLQPRINAISEFLAPYFFFTMGARLNVHVFTPDVWKAAVVISLLAIVAKVVGCGLPVLKEGWPTALQVGIGMTPRGEVGLIIALVGVQMKLISQSNYAIVIFMTAVTTLFAPPMMRLVFHRNRQLAHPAERDPAADFPASP
jgi:Kef-type K+ transport system membrane component KefB